MTSADIHRNSSHSRPGGAATPRPHDFWLTSRQWFMVATLMLVMLSSLPSVWKAIEPFDPEMDYRVPYATSQDYWLFQRHLETSLPERPVFFVGDSVVWGEYVTADSTWTAFLNQRRQEGDQSFVNLALNGLYPLALEGLVTHYAGPLEQSRVMLHFNLLWMSSPQADLSEPKQQIFNHPTLVPQWWPSVPSYHASFEMRLSSSIGHHWPWLAWVRHLNIQYWDQKDPYAWTLADDGQYPPSYPHTYHFPWEVVDGKLQGAPEADPDRGMQSSRHKAWSLDGKGTQRYPWVDLNQSLQWQAFQRLCRLMKARKNDLLVIIGPFNKHLLAPENRESLEQLERLACDWFESEGIPFHAPPTLESRLYGDASHPLTEGYALLADHLWETPLFKTWLKSPKP